MLTLGHFGIPLVAASTDIVLPPPQPGGGRTALAGKSPNRLKAQVMPTTHALFARQVQPNNQCSAVILNDFHRRSAAVDGAATRCWSAFWQLAREKSLVARRSGMEEQFRKVIKDIPQNDVCEFESSRPSQTVRSLT